MIKRIREFKMTKVLIVYATKSGSTSEIAEVIGTDIRQFGCQVDVKSVGEAVKIESYDAFVVGGPMIMGWHPQAVDFLKKNQQVFKNKPVACFMSAMSLTQAAENESYPLPVFRDPLLVKPAHNPERLSFKENFTRVSNYIKPVLAEPIWVKPGTVAIFGGKLDLAKLNLFERLFVQWVVGAKPGDYRNWEAIHSWAKDLGPLFGAASPIRQS
jgi:menaquinone-dependent protoporphyrinogen oxidase